MPLWTRGSCVDAIVGPTPAPSGRETFLIAFRVVDRGSPSEGRYFRSQQSVMCERRVDKNPGHDGGEAVVQPSPKVHEVDETTRVFACGHQIEVAS